MVPWCVPAPCTDSGPFGRRHGRRRQVLGGRRQVLGGRVDGLALGEGSRLCGDGVGSDFCDDGRPGEAVLQGRELLFEPVDSLEEILLRLAGLARAEEGPERET